MVRFALLFGAIAGMVMRARGLAPWVLSLIHDATHSYRRAMMAFIPKYLVFAGLVLLLGPCPVRRWNRRP